MDLTKWSKYQIENSKKVITKDTFDVNNIKYVGGVDISFNKKDPSISCAYLTIVNFNTNDIVYEDHETVKLTIEYVSGFLGFREVPVFKTLLDRLKQKKPELYPDVIMVDGFGILHPRGFGSATHLGYELDIPTIGVGKTLITIDGMDEKVIKNDFKVECKNKGDYIELVGKSGKLYGCAVKGSHDTTNPIYVSLGHKISLGTAVSIVLKTCKFRIPEPIRNSDIKSKLYF